MYYAMSYEAFNAAGCDVTELKLFTQPSADPEERLCGSDLVWVGGGSVANLLALWRLHGVDEAMREAWTRGSSSPGSPRAVCVGTLAARPIHSGLLCSQSPTDSRCCPTPTACTTTPKPSVARCCTN